jgi:hypothetical protein
VRYDRSGLAWQRLNVSSIYIEETIMRFCAFLCGAATLLTVACGGPLFASAGGLNRDGCGIYVPDEPPVGGRARMYRYDPRSWCYRRTQRRERDYPYYGSGYWVPRAEMRYRYRYVYRGPHYTYYPAWGYGW